jgi:2-polyprenyl-3-methyl-5-hydroxy-6-metoxy-1,4-benzoquinol methylase
MYSARVLSEDALRASYAEGYGSPRFLKGQHVNAKVDLLVLERLLPLAQVRHLLEVGSGYGVLLQRLRDTYGLDVQGVELSRQEAAYAAGTLGLKVFAGPLAEAGLAREGFDLVCCFQVIEHVADPGDFVAQLAAHTRPGGWLVVMTDNFASRVCRLMGPRFPLWIPHSHICHFTPRTLRRCLESVPGLRVTDVLSLTPWELLAMAAVALLRGRRPASECFDLERERRRERSGDYPLFWVRNLLDGWWSRAACRRHARGERLYMVARKEGAEVHA